MMLPTLLAIPPAPPGLKFAACTEVHLERAFAIESASYPEDEAATKEKLLLRMQEAPQFFRAALGANGQPCGFICGTLATSSVLTEESMSLHEPEGSTLCIHSVVVEADLRRQGIATWMLAEYLHHVQELEPPVSRILLICKEPLVNLYAGVGFQNLGPSDIVHGQDPWILMGMGDVASPQ